MLNCLNYQVRSRPLADRGREAVVAAAAFAAAAFAAAEFAAAEVAAAGPLQQPSNLRGRLLQQVDRALVFEEHDFQPSRLGSLLKPRSTVR